MTYLRITLIALVALLSGCISSVGGDTYSREDARRPAKVEFATVEYVRPVQIEGTRSGVGGAVGAVAGGVAGSTVGDGSGSKLAAIAGSLIGAAVGAITEEAITEANGIEITVRNAQGQLVAYVQERSADEPTFVVGQRVRLLKIGGATRVAH